MSRINVHVKRCDQCPFHTVDDAEFKWCIIGKHVSVILVSEASGPPPAWCSLRQNPVKVSL